jgi:hypothetical protein
MIDYLGTGLGPQNLGSPGAAGLVAFPMEVFISPVLDLSKVTLGIEIIPGRTGLIPWRTSMAWLIEDASGTQATAPVLQAGSDAAHTNFFPSSSSPTNSDVASCIGVTPCFSPGFANSSVNQQNQKFAGLPTIMDITSGGLGSVGYTLRGRFYTTVFWMSVG